MNDISKIIPQLILAIAFLIGFFVVAGTPIDSKMMIFVCLVGIFLGLCYILMKVIRFRTRTKRNVFLVFFILSFIAAIVSNINKYDGYNHWVKKHLSFGLFLDLAITIIINLVIVWIIWWIAEKFINDFKKDKQEKEIELKKKDKK